MKGKVKFFQAIKGYGFIETPEGDVFFHVTEFADHNPARVDVGQEVEFVVGESRGKKIAVEIKKLEGGNDGRKKS